MNRAADAARIVAFAIAAAAAGCAATVPRQAQVITMASYSPAPAEAFPAEGGIWRLDDSELQALGPLPVADEIRPAEPDSVAGRNAGPPAGSRDYAGYGYFIPLPAIFYHGTRFSFSYGYPGYWPRYPLAPFPRGYSRAWRYRPR